MVLYNTIRSEISYVPEVLLVSLRYTDSAKLVAVSLNLQVRSFYRLYKVFSSERTPVLNQSYSTKGC